MAYFIEVFSTYFQCTGHHSTSTLRPRHISTWETFCQNRLQYVIGVATIAWSWFLFAAVLNFQRCKIPSLMEWKKGIHMIDLSCIVHMIYLSCIVVLIVPHCEQGWLRSRRLWWILWCCRGLGGSLVLARRPFLAWVPCIGRHCPLVVSACRHFGCWNKLPL